MNNEIIVSATIHANIKKVWDYYTNPEHIIHWNFADPSWHCPNASNDLTVGGTYKARMEAKDGSFGFDFEAIYTKIVPFDEFSYTFGDRNARIKFKNLDNQTEVIVAFEPEKQHAEDLQRNGWQSILNNFKQYTESN